MKTKRISISGLAFDTYWKTPFFTIGWGEEWDMKRLAEEAQKGWIVTKIEMFNYVLKQGAPEDVQFYIDYQDTPDEDYFDVFLSAGWSHVYSDSYIHLFKAPIGVHPPHTDIDTKLVKLMHEMRRFGRYSVVSILFLSLVTWIVEQLSGAASPSLWYPVMLFVLIVSFVAAVFTVLPFFGYWRRVSKLKKKKI